MLSVELRDISKAFGATVVVRPLSLSIQPGEFLVLVGPSGCGKTTLLRLLSGLETCDSGEILFDQKPVTKLGPKERDVGMVFQSYALYPHMTVRENMAFGLKLRGTPETALNARVNEVAKMLELQELLERKPKALSGGQRQRVAMGRAIARQPKLFLLDEPLSNLDTALRVQMRGELTRLHNTLQTTTVYVTHDQVEAMTLASRVAVFNEGRLQQLGPPEVIYHQPQNRFVASFFGSPAMSFFDVARKESVWAKGALTLKANGFPSANEATVGVRPNAIRLVNDSPWKGEVKSVERLGDLGYAYVATQEGRATVQCEAQETPRVGSVVSLDVDVSSAHFFDKESGAALRHPGAKATA